MKVRDRCRCEFCAAANPRKHWKADRNLRTIVALCCPGCGRQRGFWPVDYTRAAVSGTRLPDRARSAA